MFQRHCIIIHSLDFCSFVHWSEIILIYRKARNQCIIEKLCPILAGIIAQVDTNCNLDILIKKDQRSWEYKLWLEIINNPSATQIEYSIVVSPKNKEELPEVMVKGTGCDGQQFNASMPFSWLIYKHIDQILRTSQYVETYGKIYFKLSLYRSMLYRLDF